MAAKTVPKFLALPAELRIHIWEIALEDFIASLLIHKRLEKERIPNIINSLSWEWDYNKCSLQHKEIRKWRRPTYPRILWLFSLNLHIPEFHLIMRASRESHSVPCLFWKKHVEGGMGIGCNVRIGKGISLSRLRNWLRMYMGSRWRRQESHIIEEVIQSHLLALLRKSMEIESIDIGY